MAMNQVGQQTLTVSSTAVALTMPTASPRPSHMIIQNLSANDGAHRVRWTAGATLTPTTTLGQQLIGLATLQFLDPTQTYEGIVMFFKAIREDANDVTLEIAYFSQ